MVDLSSGLASIDLRMLFLLFLPGWILFKQLTYKNREQKSLHEEIVLSSFFGILLFSFSKFFIDRLSDIPYVTFPLIDTIYEGLFIGSFSLIISVFFGSEFIGSILKLNLPNSFNLVKTSIKLRRLVYDSLILFIYCSILSVLSIILLIALPIIFQMADPNSGEANGVMVYSLATCNSTSIVFNVSVVNRQDYPISYLGLSTRQKYIDSFTYIKIIAPKNYTFDYTILDRSKQPQYIYVITGSGVFPLPVPNCK
jgi:hypothetical protein